MGNIELEQTYPKRKPIFHQPQTKKKGLSPQLSSYRRVNPYRTIKMTNQLTNSGANSDHIDTIRSKRVLGHLNDNSAIKQSARGETGNRVNNLNQFLIELRKQMKDHQSVQQSKAQNSKLQKIDSSGKIHELVLNLRLQNQKLQVEKYKKLVERQLEKSHSIEQIQLLGNQSDKKLIIKYEEIRNSKLNKRQHAVPQTSLAQKIRFEQRKFNEKLNKAKQLQQQIEARTSLLEIMLKQYEKNKCITKQQRQDDQQQGSFKENNKEYLKQLPRVNKIEGLMKEIDELHMTQKIAEREVRAALQQRDESESELSFQEHLI